MHVKLPKSKNLGDRQDFAARASFTCDAKTLAARANGPNFISEKSSPTIVNSCLATATLPLHRQLRAFGQASHGTSAPLCSPPVLLREPPWLPATLIQQGLAEVIATPHPAVTTVVKTAATTADTTVTRETIAAEMTVATTAEVTDATDTTIAAT